jgi:ubiquinone biosynthesis accessory factor UbiK
MRVHSTSCATPNRQEIQQLEQRVVLLCPILGRTRRLFARVWCELRYRVAMVDKRFFDELNERIGEAFRNSPAQDVEKNLKAMLAAGFSRLDLVLREDFEVQKKLLERAHAKLAELEARLVELESKRNSG